ncbi:hypothetical protein MMC15_001852 [Xylographa vitiligo]|nr:hypothetical protein [Xylographa vitiligo]
MAPLSLVSARAIARLRAYNPPPTTWYSLPVTRRAAVLVLLFADTLGDLRVILTLRATTLSSCKAPLLSTYYLFPTSLDTELAQFLLRERTLMGVKMLDMFHSPEADSLEETPIQTARREALEEIGLPFDDRNLPSPLQLEHLCELPSYCALTGLGVRPCVAFLHTGDDTSNAEKSLVPRLEPKEVAAIFSAPLPKFLSDRDDMGRDANTGSEWYKGCWRTWFSTRGRVHQFSVPRGSTSGDATQNIYQVLGMTARMILDTARLAYAEDPSFSYEPQIGDENMLRKLLESGRFSVEKIPGSSITSDDAAIIAKL